MSNGNNLAEQLAALGMMPPVQQEQAGRPFTKPEILDVKETAERCTAFSQHPASMAAMQPVPVRGENSVTPCTAISGSTQDAQQPCRAVQSTGQTPDARYREFSALFSWFYANYRQTPEAIQVSTAWTLLQGYPLENIRDAMLQYIRTHGLLQQMPVADLEKILRAKLNSKLTAEARRIYRLIGCYLYGGDIVIASKRGAYALRTAFGSIRTLAARPQSDYARQQDEEAFVQAFINYEPMGKDPALYVFEGEQSDEKRPRVSFVGDYAACRRIAMAYYPAKGMQPSIPLTKAEINACIEREERRKREAMDKYLAEHGCEAAALPEFDSSRPVLEQVGELLQATLQMVTPEKNQQEAAASVN